MQALINQVNIVNKELIKGINDTYKLFGLVKVIKKGEEQLNLDIEKDEQVFIDDNYKSFFYHKLNGQETYELVSSRGKNKLYNARAPMSIICYSEFKNFDDHIKNRLSNLRDVTLSAIDYDANKIISQETGKKDFDFNKYLFVVNYQILYKTNNCYGNCQ